MTSNIIKSNNTQGNPYHKGKGSPQGGQFTSSSEFSNSYRNHIANPYYDKLVDTYEGYGDLEPGDEGYEEAKNQIEKVIKEFNTAGLEMIMEDTGLGFEEALYFQNSLIEYCGGDYTLFNKKYRPKEVQAIDEGISKMPKYKGKIFRGVSFSIMEDDENKNFQNLLSNLKEGATISIKDSPSSWTSDLQIASTNFARNFTDLANSVIFVCNNNKSGASIQHLSKFGPEEAEVLVPSNVKYKIKKIETIDKPMKSKYFLYNTKLSPSKSIVCYLEEI